MARPVRAPVAAGCHPHAVETLGRACAVVHDWRVPQREHERHEARRGRRHAYEHLDPQRTALVVVDVVSFFAEASPYAQGVVPNINALAGALRSEGGTVAWVLPSVPPEPTPWAVGFYGPEIARRYAASGGRGQVRDRLWHALDARDADLFVEKSASSAFFPTRSDLPEHLEAAGIDTVLIAGTVTSVCCESSARDASTLGYRVVLVADGCADVSDEAHNATLRTVYRSFGDVRPTTELLDLLRTDGRP